MSKKNGNMHIVALQTSLAAVQHERDQLAVALAELGYCHEQQTNFITNEASRSTSVDFLFGEAKVALAEAVETNKRLTDDLEFQAHRYTLLQAEAGAKGKALAALSAEYQSEVERLKARVNTVLTGGRLVAAVLAIAVAGLSLQVAGVF